MKSANPRWSCQLIRTCHAIFNHTGGLGTILSSHVGRCAGCRAYYASVVSLDTALRRDAIQTQSAPPELHRGIMEAVARSAMPPRPRRQRKPAIWLVALGACAVFAFVLVSIVGTSPSVSMPAAATNGSALATNDPPAWSTVIAPVNSVLNEEPLQSEANRVYDDARSAVHFLALNFLPSDIASSDRGSSHARQGPNRADG